MMNISLTPFASQSGPPPYAGGVPCVQGPLKQTKPKASARSGDAHAQKKFLGK